MDINQYTRDPSKVKAVLKELPDGSVICTSIVKIYIPERYVSRNMAVIGSDNYILGIYCIAVEDKYYGVSLVNAMIPIDPDNITTIVMDGDKYIEFIFNKGSTVFKATNLVKTKTLVYYIYDEFFAKGNIPWYFTYEDLGNIFNTARYHAGANIGSNTEITQLITSIVARDSKDRTKHYRNTLKTLSDIHEMRPAFIPLKSVEYASTNTMNKLGGSYMNIGITSALLDKTQRVEKIESLMTS